MKKIFTLSLFIFLGFTLKGLAQTITAVSTSSSAYCAGNLASVSFTATGFTGSPTFTVELSNAAGSFTTATSLSPTTSSSPVNVTLPAGLASGTGYKVRVKSGAVTSLPSAAFTVTALPAAPSTTTSLGYCLNYNAPALTPNSGIYKWYTMPSGGTGVSSITPVTSSTGAINYFVSQTVNGCESPRTTVTVLVGTVPATPTVVSPISYCVGNTATPLTTTNTTGTLNWYVGTGTTASSSVTPSTATVGSTNYSVSQTVSGCESPKATIAVTVFASPLASPVVTTPVNYCLNQTGVTTLSVPATSGLNTIWYDAANAVLASAPTPSTATVGAVSYSVSYKTTNGCESAKSTITVNTNAYPSGPPSVSTPLNICQNITVPASQLTALPSTGNSVRWYSNLTGGTPLVTAPTPIINVSTPTTYTYYVTQVNTANCEYSPRTAVVVNVNVTAAPSVTSPVIECLGRVARPLSEHVTTPASGFSLVYYDATGTASSTVPTPTTNATGSTTYYVTQKNNTTGCESTPRTPITVNVNAVPTAPSVTSPVNICQNATSVSPLSASPSSGGALLWWGTSASGGSSSSTAPTPSSSTATSTTYYVSQAVSGCESSRVPISVVVNALPSAPSATSVLYCQNDDATPMAAGMSSTSNTLKWYNGSTVLGSSSPTPLTNVSSTTTYSYSVSQVTPAPASCEGPATPVTATVYVTPAPTYTNPVYCQNSTAIALSANPTQAGGVITWYSAPTGAASSGAPTPSTNTVANTTYYVTQRLYAVSGFAGCENKPRAAITVTVNPQPTAPTVTTPTYCQNYNSQPLSANGTSLKWYTDATTNTSTTTAPTPSTASSGTVNYYVTQTNSFNCESPRAPLAVTINPTPTQPGVTAVSFCQNYPTTALNASASSGNTLSWYGTNQSGGTAASSAPTPPSNNAGGFNYYVSQTNSFSCESPRAALLVTINPTPSAPSVRTPDVYCQNETAQALSVNVDNGSGPRWYDGSNNAISGGTPTPNTSSAANLTYFVSQVNGFNCESPKSQISITVKPLPVAPSVPNNNYVLCQLDPTLTLSATGSGLKWYLPNGNISTDAPVISTGAGLQTSYSVSSVVNGCEGPKAKIDILIRTTPTPTVPNIPSVYCQQNNKFETLPVTGSNLKWYDKPTGGIQITINGGVVFTETPGTYYSYVTQTNASTGCESPRVEVVGIVQPLPTATISGESSITQGQSATLKIAFSGQGPWTYTLSNGFTTTTTQNPTTVTVTPIETTVFTVTKITNNCGNGTPIGSATINVKTATVQTGNPNVASLCAGTSFSIPYFSSDFIPSDAKYTIQIAKTNDDAAFQSIPTENVASPLKGTIPSGTSGGNYFVRILAVASNFSLKGQVSPVQVFVRELPTATISGPAAIYENETAKITIALAGESPWTVVYKDSLSQQNTTETLNASPFEFSAVLKQSNTYSIVSITNACGNGPATSKVRVKVSPLLSVGPITAGSEWLKVYPMPVQTKCIVEIEGNTVSKPAQIRVLDELGRVSQQHLSNQTAIELDLGRLNSGTYFIRVEQNGRIAIRKILKID